MTQTASLINSLVFSLVFLCFSVTGSGADSSFDLHTLTTLSNLKFLGDAHIYNNTTIRLTGDLTVPNSGAGRVVYNKPITLHQTGTSFTTHFTISINNLNPNSIGGGSAFLISPDNESIGAGGGSLGIPPNSIAIEFDTAKDVEFKDINGNHVGLDVDSSLVSLYVTDLGSVNISLKSGKLIRVWVDYSGLNHHLKVFVSYSKTKPSSPVLSVTTVDVYQNLNGSMYVGFSGSTQGSTEIHTITDWTFATSSFDDADKKSVTSPPTMAPAASNNISTTPDSTKPRKNRSNWKNKLIKWLVIALTAGGLSVLAGGITIYINHQNGAANPHVVSTYFNFCNFGSHVNNGQAVAV